MNYTIDCIYKFMEEKYLDAFLNGDSVRIGTLHEYMNEEQYDLATLDTDEGAVNINDSSGTMVLNEEANPQVMHQLRAAGIIDSSSHFNITMHSIHGTHLRIESPNAHIFCASEECEPDISAGLNTKYDVCVKIGNPIAFHHSLQTAYCLYSPKSADNEYHSQMFQMIYKSRHLNEDDDNYEFGAHIKDTAFAYQKECRILFNANIADKKPLIIPFDSSDCDLSICWRKD